MRICQCLQCGLPWCYRGDGEPIRCGKCKSPYWNRRKRDGGRDQEAKGRTEGQAVALDGRRQAAGNIPGRNGGNADRDRGATGGDERKVKGVMIAELKAIAAGKTRGARRVGSEGSQGSGAEDYGEPREAVLEGVTKSGCPFCGALGGMHFRGCKR